MGHCLALFWVRGQKIRARKARTRNNGEKPRDKPGKEEENEGN